MPGSYSVLQVTPLPVSTGQNVNDFEKENVPSPRYETIGGILFDTKYIWTSNGPQFTILNSKTGAKIAAWSFGLIVKDNSTKVVCVDELHRPIGKPPLLVIGLECDLTGGMICIFDMLGSRVLRAIQINDKVTSLNVIDANYDKCPLPGPLRAFDGILAIGTAGGSVLLLDICRQTCDEASGLGDVRDEVNSCLLKTLFLNDIYSLELHKQMAIKNGEHLSLYLNATDNGMPHFVLKGPKGDDRVHVNKVEVKVSALHYCPQLGSLLVGYNFGAWQLWNLINLELVYTSPIYEENIPVSHFAIQEPCDDPRAFCYVWVIYSNTEPYQTGFPVAVLYSLNYDTKEWHEGYGILYQDLTSCAVRLQTDLAFLGDSQTADVRQGAHCLRLQAISKSISKGGSLQEHQEETLSLCSVIWTAWSSRSNTVAQTYMSLFDLNQWYKEQMPSSPGIKNCETYMANVCLSNVLQTVNSGQAPFLDVRMDINTLSQFFGSQRLEEHYYPSSLAFQLCALREKDITFFNNQGTQRALLCHLESGGPVALLKPSELFQQCIDLGMFPLFVDIPNNTSLSLDYQRELLLSVALEQQLLGWLCRCASAWSGGSHSGIGCTLQFILSWGWERAHVLKLNADKLSMPLFDYSGLRLDANTHSLLSNCARQLKNLSSLFGYIVRRFERFLLYPEVVKQQWESLEMVSVHLEVLQWLLNVGLLPECPLSSYPRADECNRISAPYPVNSLMEYYDERRTHLQSLNKEQFSTSGSLLFIDNLIELECGGHKLQKQWESDGGNGLYPPPSLQALLRTYLIEDVDISLKHCIVVYVFLDLAMTLDQSRYKPIITHLIKFPAVFQLSPSIIKITQAFWQLDHGDFNTAMEQLLDPLVRSDDLKMWHHRVALNALLTQKQNKCALLYLQVRKPPIVEVQDLCTVISLYITNNMLDEAFHFQRRNRNSKNEQQLLRHFYYECDRKGDISSVLYLPLTSLEEEALWKYLQEVNHSKMQDLQVFYYLQHSRYIDAFQCNDKLNKIEMNNKGLEGQEQVSIRDRLVKDFADSLPEVSKSLMNVCQKEKNGLWKEVARPKPLSVFVHNTSEQINYKSSIINAVLSKAKETWSHPILNTSIKKDHSNHFTKIIATEDTPFLNTPKAIPYESRISTPIIFPRLEVQVQDEDGATPSKRFKLSPRSLTASGKSKDVTEKSTNMDVAINNCSIKLDTPVIKRKMFKTSGKLALSEEKFSVGTPQSILKVNNLVRSSRSPDNATTPESINVITRSSDESISSLHEVATSLRKLNSLRRKTSLGLTPRKPLPRTPRYAVRFDISRASSESSLTSNTSELTFEVIHDKAIVHTPVEEIDKRVSELKANTSQQSVSEVSSKNSSLVTDEVFYSPDASISSNAESKSMSEIENIKTDENNVFKQNPAPKDMNVNVIQENLNDSHKESPRSRRSYKRHQEDADVIQTSEEVNEVQVSINESIKTDNIKTVPVPPSPKTPRSRRSYKDSLPAVGVRSSPRLRKFLLKKENIQKETPKALLEKENIHIETSKSQLNETAASTLSEISESLLEETPQTSPQEESFLKTKLRGRRSLTRQVLESNAFQKMMDTSSSSNLSVPALLRSNASEVEFSYSKIETTFESKSSDEVTKESSTVVTEDYKDVFTLDKDNKQFEFEPSLKHTHEESNTVSKKSRQVKISDESSSESNSSAISFSFDPLDNAYIADPLSTLLRPSTSTLNAEENSVQEGNDVAVCPVVEVIDKLDHELLEKSDTFEQQQEIFEKIAQDFDEDQELTIYKENDEDEEENVSGEVKNQVTICDSDADTVIIETDVLTDTANVYEDLSSSDNYGSADPQMNVFEISDDLDLNNDGMCVGENVDILDIETNYDDEVFGDEAEVLSNVVAVNESSLGQPEISETHEFNRNMRDQEEDAVNVDIPQSEDIQTEEIKGSEYEVIELNSSSNDSNRDSYSVSNQSSRSLTSPQNSDLEEEYEEVDVGEGMNEEDSYTENSNLSNEIRSVNDHSDRDSLIDDVQRPREILSESESPKTNESMSDNDSSMESDQNRNSAESADEKVEFRKCDEEKSYDQSRKELSSEISEDSSEVSTDNYHLEVIPEESSDFEIENSPKLKESELDVLVAAAIETNSQSDVVSENITDVASPLEIVPTKEAKEKALDVEDRLDIIAETCVATTSTKPSGEDSELLYSNQKDLSTKELKEDMFTDQRESSSAEKSLSVEQQTVIEVQYPKKKFISAAERKIHFFRTETDIVDKTQIVESSANSNPEDILKEPDVSEETPLNVKSRDSMDCLIETDILDATVRQSTGSTLSNPLAVTDILETSDFLTPRNSLNVLNYEKDILDHTVGSAKLQEKSGTQTDVLDSTASESVYYTFKSAKDENDFDESPVNFKSLNTPVATTDILEASGFLTPRDNLNVLSQRDILDRTVQSAKLPEKDDESFSKNVDKSSTPARRSRRLSSLQPTTLVDQLSVKNSTRRSVSFTNLQKIDVSGPSTSKEEPVAARELRRRSSSTTENTSTPARRKRSASADVKLLPLKKRTLRSPSTDEIKNKESEAKSASGIRSRRASSVVVELPVIKEESKRIKNETTPTKNVKRRYKGGSSSPTKSSKSESGLKQKQLVKPLKKSKSTITAVASKNKMEDYVTTRRLTRRQANLMEKTIRASELSAQIRQQEVLDNESDDSDIHDRGPDITTIDPIKLLDKESFEGKPDSDEEKTLQHASSPSVPESPVNSETITVQLRSRSSMSNISPRSELSVSQSEPSTSKKEKHKSVKRVLVGVASRTKQRSKSNDESIAKLQEKPSPPKLRKIQKGSKETERSKGDVNKPGSSVETKQVTRMRTRSSSISDQVETAESPLRRSERRANQVKSELSQITEEQSTRTVTDKGDNKAIKPAKRNLRKHSSAK